MITISFPVAALSVLVGLISLGFNLYQYNKGRLKDKLLTHIARGLQTNAAELAKSCEEGKVESVKCAGELALQLSRSANSLLAAIEEQKLEKETKKR